ncbi:hypothetical protein K9L05_02555 [Candidatus Babeliales bacterium]|nr:hypothetical protein [Candidatus Babeliales bacterium]MCF7899507.1 hypothetical protein [Candidatus Babeliales bacterium]
MSKNIKNIVATIVIFLTVVAIIYVKFVQKKEIFKPVKILREKVQTIKSKKTISADFFTQRDKDNNIDSLAIWHGFDGQDWLLATAKATAKIIIYDAATGEFIQEFGTPGNKIGEFSRPNGIFVIDNFAFVTERDNKRVQVFSLPDCSSLGFIGEDTLKRPYGITIFKNNLGKYIVYVTDSYETKDLQAMDKRVHIYEVDIKDNVLSSKFIKYFGDIEGAGVLYKVESVAVDPENNRLFVADESPEQKNIKVYDLKGNFLNQFLGDNMFLCEPEGIAIYRTGLKNGFIITTDQSIVKNIFHVFDRLTLKHLGSFKAEKTSNTDGIIITTRPLGKFLHGIFYAVNDDGNITAINWDKIMQTLGLDKKPEKKISTNIQVAGVQA